MNELAVIERAEVVPTLDELAATINCQHAEVVRSLETAVHQAIAAGHALIRARQEVPGGEWMRWVSENVDFSYLLACTYIRFATFEETVRDVPTVSAGLKLLRSSEKNFKVPTRKEEAQKLRESGWSIANIAAFLDVSAAGLQRHFNPEIGDKQNRKRALARRNQKATNRARIAEGIGGGINATFKAIRRAQIDANNLSESGASPEIRQAATLAYHAMCRAEDEIAKILADA